MLEFIPYRSFLMSSAVRALICLTKFGPQDPAILKTKCHDEIVARLNARYAAQLIVDKNDQTKGSFSAKAELRRHADWYFFRAQLLWGQPSVRSHTKAAWFYATAGQLSVLADDIDRASDLYHFAGNAMRLVQLYEHSINAYEKAAHLSPKPEWKQRCYQRALGVASLAGNDYEVTRLYGIVKELSHI